MTKYRISICTIITVFIFMYCTPTYALETYDVGHGTICHAVKTGNMLYYSSSDEHLVVEYDTILSTQLRTWDTGEMYPMFIRLHLNLNELIVLLHSDEGIDLTRYIATINLQTGNYSICPLNPMPIINIANDYNGENILVSCGDQVVDPGEICLINCTNWTITNSVETGDYPLGITYYPVYDAIYISCADTIPTYYIEGEEEYSGPPYMGLLQKYNSRLELDLEIYVPEGINYIKKMDENRLMTLHLPMAEAPSTYICIIDAVAGDIIDEIVIPEIRGVLDAVFSPSTGKIYATVVVAGDYDPECDVPELAYCGHFLVYDTSNFTYELYEDYFDSDVSMINLYEGQLVINSSTTSRIYIETPF